MARDYVAQGYFILFFALTCYLLSITQIALYAFDMKLGTETILLFCIPLIIEIVTFNRLFPNAQVNYEIYENERKNEKHKWFKGLLIFLFLTFSLISFVFVSFFNKSIQ